MVGIGPDGNGEFHPTAVKQLKQVGKWLRRNGEAIYATRAREEELWKEGDNIRYTLSKDRLSMFVHCFELPEKELVLKTVKPEAKSRIFLLGNKTPLKWTLSSSGELHILIPEGFIHTIPAEERFSYTFKILR